MKKTTKAGIIKKNISNQFPGLMILFGQWFIHPQLGTSSKLNKFTADVMQFEHTLLDVLITI